jgi:hypothetical protein
MYLLGVAGTSVCSESHNCARLLKRTASGTASKRHREVVQWLLWSVWLVAYALIRNEIIKLITYLLLTIYMILSVIIPTLQSGRTTGQYRGFHYCK